jgi:hypothetical protein
MSPQSTLQSRNSSTSVFSEGTMPTVTFVAWLVPTVKRNRGNWPTPQCELKPILHHVVPSVTVGSRSVFRSAGMRDAAADVQSHNAGGSGTVSCCGLLPRFASVSLLFWVCARDSEGRDDAMLTIDHLRSSCHEPSHSSAGGLASNVSMRLDSVIDGPSPGATSRADWKARRASSQFRAR